LEVGRGRRALLGNGVEQFIVQRPAALVAGRQQQERQDAVLGHGPRLPGPVGRGPDGGRAAVPGKADRHRQLGPRRERGRRAGLHAGRERGAQRPGVGGIQLQQFVVKFLQQFQFLLVVLLVIFVVLLQQFIVFEFQQFLFEFLQFVEQQFVIVFEFVQFLKLLVLVQQFIFEQFVVLQFLQQFVVLVLWQRRLILLLHLHMDLWRMGANF
jgi:hypothetical protein